MDSNLNHLSQQDIGQILTEALAHHKSNEFDKAVMLYQKILKIDVNHIDALHLLGTALYQLGRHTEAITFINKAIQLNPNVYYFYNNLGEVYRAQEKFQEAINCYNRAILLNPNYSEAYLNKGNALKQQNLLNEAITCYQQAIQVNPNYFRAYNCLGYVYQVLKKFDQALSCFTQSLHINPNFFESYNLLGQLYQACGDQPQAAKYFQKAVVLNPRFFEGYNSLARYFYGQDKLDQAQEYYQTSLNIEPDQPEILNDLGAIHQAYGRLSEAEKYYRKAVQVAPHYAQAYRHLSLCRKYKGYDHPDIDTIKFLLNRSDCPEVDQIQLCFALGKIYDDCKQYDKAFFYYQKGNQLKRKTSFLNFSELTSFTDSILQVFNASFFNDISMFGSLTNQPVFVVGMPRSGTTLVEQIIASHPDGDGVGEINAIHQSAHTLSSHLNKPVSFPTCLAFIKKEALQVVAEQYLNSLHAHSKGSFLRIVNKMPNNFFYLGLIWRLFPHAYIIHCTREPLDTCLSIYFRYFSHENRYAYDFSDISAYYKNYQRLISHWKAFLPIPIFNMQYEALVSDFEVMVHKLLTFLNLQPNKQCLSFYKSPNKIHSASSWQVRQPIYTSAVNRWKNYEPFIASLIEFLKK